MKIHGSVRHLLPKAVMVCVLALSGQATANVILSFEGPLPSGLAATSFWQGLSVPDTAKVTDQYLSQGIVISGAALVEGGLGHVASGVNGLAGIDGGGNINYDAPLTFSFFQPGYAGLAGTTDYFAISPDLSGGSGNIITISAYDFGGALIAQINFTETGTFTSPLSLSGVGQFHKVTVDQTLINAFSGGIILDLVEFGDITPTTSVPEPGSLGLMGLGLAGLGFVRRRKGKFSTPEKSNHKYTDGPQA